MMIMHKQDSASNNQQWWYTIKTNQLLKRKEKSEFKLSSCALKLTLCLTHPAPVWQRKIWFSGRFDLDCFSKVFTRSIFIGKKSECYHRNLSKSQQSNELRFITLPKSEKKSRTNKTTLNRPISVNWKGRKKLQIRMVCRVKWGWSVKVSFSVDFWAERFSQNLHRSTCSGEKNNSQPNDLYTSIVYKTIFELLVGTFTPPGFLKKVSNGNERIVFDSIQDDSWNCRLWRSMKILRL